MQTLPCFQFEFTHLSITNESSAPRFPTCALCTEASTPAPSLTHIPQHHSHTSLKPRDGDPMHDPVHEETLPNAHCKLSCCSSSLPSPTLTCRPNRSTLQPPFRQLQRAMRSSLSHLFSRLNNPKMLHW